MELLDIVDEEGNLTGKVMEKEKVHDLNLLHWEIAVFVINNQRQILLQKRAATKRFNPNKWGLCAGHVDSMERLEDAALREVYEEIGIKLTLDDLKVLYEKEVKIRESNSHITRYYYAIYNGNDFTIQEEELSEVKWFDIDDVIDMISNNNDTIVFKSDRLYLLDALKNIEL